MLVSADSLIKGTHYEFLRKNYIYTYIGPSEEPNHYEFVVFRHPNGYEGKKRILSNAGLRELREIPIPTSNEQALSCLRP